MTPTTANRPRVCAQLIRAAAKAIDGHGMPIDRRHVDDFENALASLDAIADELDPPRPASSEPETPR